MTRVRVFFVFAFIFSCVALLTAPAHAATATTDFRVLLDVDNNTATGCLISGMAGTDQILVTRVVTDDVAGTGQVTRTFRQVCTSGILGAPVDVIETGWPAGFQTASGDVLVETRVPFSAVGGSSMPHNLRIGIEASQGAALHTAIALPDGSPVFFPTYAHGKRRSVGAPGADRLITLDGIGTDWFGIPPMFSGIASTGTQGLRMVRFYGFANDIDDFLYFRFDGNLSNDAPFAEDDDYTRTAGTPLNVSAPGVLDNDGDPNGLPLTATPVAPAAHGTVTLNPDGSFTYTPNSPDTNENDAFEYKASNGTKLSNAARVRISVDSSVGNQAPVFTSSASVNVAEGTTGVTTITTTDADGDTVTLAITGGADQARFTLGGSALAFAAAPDFEAPNDADFNGVYVVDVTADDGNGGTTVQTLSVAVTNVDETPSFTTSNTFSIDENTTAVGTVSASDPDGTAVTYAITGGADSAQFTINATTGALSLNAAPDFENPVDAGGNNTYVVQVTASDGPNFVSQTITVTITDVNEAPAFTSTANPAVPENTTAVATVSATDPEGTAVTYSITGGADMALFSINGATGALTFNAAPNFEAPADASTNNVYAVTVQATDGVNPVTQAISVTVTDVNEAPVITTGNTATIAENTTAVLTVASTDDDGTAATYAVTGGADQALFTINATTGALAFAAGPNFEAPADADANNAYIVQITATDGTNNVNQTITVTVTNVDEAPVFTSAAAAAVPENTTPVLTVTTTEPEGQVVTYTLTGGADVARFAINGATGALSFVAAPNFETPADADTNNVYLVQVTATDGTTPVNQTLSVTVSNVNEAPVITSLNAATIAENTTGVLTVTTTDEEGDAITYSTSGGADAGAFAINATTGALSFVAAPNFELPADADTNNVYLVQVTATDGTTPVSQLVTVTVSNVNEAPVITSLDAASVAENTTAVTTVTTTDQEGDAITYALTGGADMALFSVNATTGVLTFNAAPNFETPADADANNIYLVQVTATDGTNPVSQLITVTVTNVNEAPVITSANTVTIPENTVVATTVTTTDQEGDTIAYSITGGADQTLFSINATSGVLSFNAAPNFEVPADADTNNQYIVQVTVTDGTTPVSQTITITVTDINEAPVFTSSATASVVEGNTAVTTVATTDEEGDTVTYSITGGADQALFSINATTGALTFNAAPDFESPADADTDNDYLVDVTATDGTTPVIQSLTVTVTNTNEAPAFTSGSTPSVAENTTAVLTVTTTDQEGDTVTYSVTGGADAALFSINSTTGALTFNAAPNFEAPADADANNTYLVQVTASDGTNNVNVTITVTVTNVNEAPSITSGNTASVAENTTAVTTVTSTDEEGDTVTYSITGGADQALFSINATTGALTFNSAPNFEAPADADTNNDYIVQVTANDGTNNTNQTITVTVTDINEAPSITSGNTASVAENTTAVVTVTTSDPEGNTITYSITGGADQALFSINSTSGALTFNAAPNFEAPADADANNAYIVQVTADDGTNSVNQTITVTVTNVDEAPSITSASTASTAENTTAVTTVTSNDPEGDTVTYSITGGADAALFAINGTTGVVTFLAAPDFEAPADADTNNAYIVQVTANDGTNNTNQTITVTVTDVNEAPSFTSGATPSVAENTTAVTTVTATDPEGNALTFSITAGADQALFSINATSGALTFNAGPDFESPADADANNTYLVDVTVTDGTNPVVQSLTVTVTNTNEAPSITSANTASTAENSTAVLTVTTTDAESDTITYSVSGGADQALFSIDSSTGVLTFNAAPDFESPADADTNNAYIVQVTATDGTTPVNQTITVTVTDVNEAPSFTSSATPSVPENTTAVTTVTATDPEGNSLTYSITGGDDQLQFAINATTGALTFMGSHNFEAPNDLDTDNVYLVQVTVTDGTNPVVQSLSVTVTDVNEGPSITSSNAATVAENSTAVLTVTTSDPESDTITYSISGGADAGDFSIDSSTGALTFAVAPNFENPADADANNIYLVDVTATDGTTPATQTITVTVTNVDEQPVFTSSAAPSVPENTTAVVTVQAVDPEGATPTYSITGGADQAKFTINVTTGALSFLAAPDFEVPGDADTNNTYVVQVTASDSNPAVQTITVTVTDANDPPSFTSSATPSVPENTTAVITVTATDPESGTVTYSITGGADQAKFALNTTTGALSFLAAPDFETPADAGANNVYDVQVTATDGTNPAVQNLAVTVTNVNEAPSITSANSATVAENSVAVLTVTTSDPESDTITYSISGGADQAAFSIDSSTGVLTFIAPPDFETPTDADTNNVYLVQVTATDGTTPVNQSITVTVTDVDEAPFFTSTATPSRMENVPTTHDVDATDPEGATVTFSIVGGDDAADFSINTTTGVLSFLVNPNFEAPHDADTDNVYLVDVQASDGTLTAVQNISWTVTDVNEIPLITSSNTNSVPENQTNAHTVVGSDPDAGTTLTYSITGGDDQAKFAVDSSTGVLSFLVAPDFENPTDADVNNEYQVEVTVSDGANSSGNLQRITVTNVDEAPVFTSATSASVAENQTNAMDVDATDPEGATLTYSITGGADSGDFTINSSTGVLTFSATPNFEAPADADTNNAYIVQVTATDGTNPVNQTITITVTNVNEAPVNTLQDNTVSTNEDINLVFSSANANQVSVSDPDGDVTVQVSLTATNGTLSLNGVTGLTFVPPGAGNDGVDDTTLVFTGTTSNINARLSGLTYKPNANYYGPAAITILTDDQGNSGSGGALQSNGGVADSIAVTVNPVNDKPTTASYTVANGTAHITHSGIGITISASDSNELKEDASDVDDHDPYSELTVQIVPGSLSPANATLTLIDASTGAFYFEPPGGLSGSGAASFQYQVCDDGDTGLGLAAQCSDPATVQFTITGADTWFVDDTDAAGCGVTCNGSRRKPLVGLNNVALAGRGTGDRIFVFSGTYNHGFTMAANETLVGQASTGAFDTILGVSVPSNGTLDTRPSLSGAAVTLQNTVTAASSILMRGIAINSTSNGFVASGAPTMTVLESSVIAAGKAVDLTNSGASASGITFTSTSSTGGTHGISLQNVSGTLAFGTGNLAGNTTASFFLKDANSSQITYSGNMAPSGSGRAVLIGTADGNSGVNASNGLEAGSSVTLSGNLTAGGVAVYESSGGTLNLSSATHTFNTGATNAVELIDNNGATINFSGGNLNITTTTGKGFHASQGGTVNVTGANNVIVTGNGLGSGSSGGIGVQVLGTSTETMGGQYTFKSVTSSWGTKGVSVQYHSGPFTITGTDGADAGTDPDAGTGGTINQMTQRGVELTNVTGAISVGGMNFTNAGTTNGVANTTCGDSQAGDNTNCNAAIHLISDSASATLNQISINGGAQMGVNTRGVNNLVIKNIVVQNVGDESLENGMMLVNTTGTGEITNGNFHDNESRQVHIYNGSGTLSSFNIKGCTFANSVAPNGNMGLILEASGASTVMNVTTGGLLAGEGNTFSNLFSNGWHVASSNNATANFSLIGSAGTNCNSLAVAQASLGSTMTVTIDTNTWVAGANQAAGPISLKTDGGGDMIATVQNNTLGQNGVAFSGSPASCGNCVGMFINPRFSTNSTITVRGNTIQGMNGSAIYVQPGEDTSYNVNTIITGNLIRQPSTTTAVALDLRNGVSGAPVEGPGGCHAITLGGSVTPGAWPSTTANAKNRIEGDWGTGSTNNEVILFQSDSSLLKLVGYTTGDVRTFVQNNNSITSTMTNFSGFNVTTVGTISTAGTSCP